MRKRIHIALVAFALMATGLACDLSSLPIPLPGLPSPTVPPSPTPLPSPTPMPSPTPSPSPTSSAPVDVSALLAEIDLAADDIPESYVEVPAEDFGLTAESLSDEDFTVSKIVFLMSEESLEFSLALLFPLETTSEQVLFDAAISDPEVLVASLAEGMAGEGVEVTETGSLTGLEDIGDAAAGYGFQYATAGLGMQIDVVIFRRSAAGAMTAVIYLEGRSPQMSAVDLARVVDEEIDAVLK